MTPRPPKFTNAINNYNFVGSSIDVPYIYGHVYFTRVWDILVKTHFIDVVNISGKMSLIFFCTFQVLS